MSKVFTVDEVGKHCTENDCWIIVHDKVFDVTSFLKDHPGGKKVILRVAGTDASKQFDSFHKPAVLQQYSAKLCIGVVGSSQTTANLDPMSVPAEKRDKTSKVSDLLNISIPAQQANLERDSFGDLVPFGDPSWYQDWYSPYYNNTHRLVRAAVRQFVDTEIMSHCHQWDEDKIIPRDLFRKIAAAGLLPVCCGPKWPTGLADPPVGAEWLATEFDNFHELIFIDEISRAGSGGVVWALFGGLGIGLPPVLKFGSQELKERIVKPCFSGDKIICLAITEPSAGSDVANLHCEAKKTADGKHYIVNGEKKWITNGTFADFFTVAVRTGGPGMGGLSLLVIERTMPGITTRQMKCQGVWPSGTSYITFEDVKVPVENLVGSENKGFKYIMYNFNHERMAIVYQATRFARVCLEEAIKYSHKRKTFGKRLIDHPVIRNKIAHMARMVEATHSWMENVTYQLCKLNETEGMMRLGGAIALLKAQSTQTFEFCAREASQILGGIAYTRGGQGEKVERLYREVRAYAIPGGSEEIMLELGIRQSMKVGEFLGAKM